MDSIKDPKGYLTIEQTIEAPDIVRGIKEFETMTCCHCNRVVVKNPMRVRERGHCFRCNRYVCDHPGCNAGCTPVEQSLDLGLEIGSHRAPVGNNGKLIW